MNIKTQYCFLIQTEIVVKVNESLTVRGADGATAA